MTAATDQVADAIFCLSNGCTAADTAWHLNLTLDELHTLLLDTRPHRADLDRIVQRARWWQIFGGTR